MTIDLARYSKSCLIGPVLDRKFVPPFRIFALPKIGYLPISKSSAAFVKGLNIKRQSLDNLCDTFYSISIVVG